MGSYNTTCESCNAGAENDSSPLGFLHGWQAQLCEEESAAAVGTPGVFELIDADLGEGRQAGFAEREAGVVE